MDAQLIIGQIRGTTIERQRAIQLLASNIKLQTDIESYVMRSGGDVDDAKMIFHDSVLAFVKRVFTDREFELSGNVDGYIFGIAKHLLCTNIRNKKPSTAIEAFDLSVFQSNDFIAKERSKDNHQVLHKILDKMSPKCKEVLLYWAGGYSMEEIAKLVNYQSEGMARKKKCDCFKSLVKLLKDQPHLLNELKS